LLRSWDGQTFCDLGDATWAIEFTGLNEAVQHLTGQELHEGDEALAAADRILEYLAQAVHTRSTQEGMRFVLAQPTQIEARRRFAMVDGQQFPDQARRVVKTEGLTQDVSYTAGAQAAIGVALTTLERIELEGHFQRTAPVDACVHAALPDLETSAEALFEVIRSAYERTDVLQVTFDA
jgi:ribonucleoside-triphosphate reductase